ncbi:MAG: hypothetical protein A2521_05940 [Deltaproteobacteria bacterium RIFOXYD12_FULL_57_12]|nr:MAG: hypothetical protein A2521_05940 [Deltaproteobacteria bacterium RIFOXYD12_FULL_57_12]
MSDDSETQRQRQRLLVDDILLGVTIMRSATGQEIWGAVVDRSKNGLQLTVPVEFSAGEQVAIGLPQDAALEFAQADQFVGRICWCRQDDLLPTSYNVGVEIL